MSNDLSVNMRRAELDRKSEERANASKRLREALVADKRSLWNTAVSLLDDHAIKHAFWREDLIPMAKFALGEDFIQFYLTHSNAPKSPR